MNTLSPSLVDPSFRRALVRYARRRVPAADVEDVVQETLCDTLAAAAPLSNAELLRWSLTILRRRIADLYRVRAKSPLAQGSTNEPGSPDPHDALEARDCLARLDFAHEAMDLILEESAGEPLEYVAKERGLTAEAARQRVSRHRKRLRAWLAAAATLCTLLFTVAKWRHRAEAEEAARAGSFVQGLAAASGSYRLTAIEADPTVNPVLRDLARATLGADLRIGSGAVWLNERVVLFVDRVDEAGFAHGRTSWGEGVRLRVRSAGNTLRIESRSGPLQGELVLTRQP